MICLRVFISSFVTIFLKVTLQKFYLAYQPTEICFHRNCKKIRDKIPARLYNKIGFHHRVRYCQDTYLSHFASYSSGSCLFKCVVQCLVFMGSISSAQLYSNTNHHPASYIRHNFQSRYNPRYLKMFQRTKFNFSLQISKVRLPWPQ